jgi:hypothetical protein
MINGVMVKSFSRSCLVSVVMLFLAQISNSFAQEVTIDLVKVLGPIYQLDSLNDPERSANQLCTEYKFNKVASHESSNVMGFLNDDGFTSEEGGCRAHLGNFCSLFLSPIANTAMLGAAASMMYSGIDETNARVFVIGTLAWGTSLTKRMQDGSVQRFCQRFEHLSQISNYLKFEKLECTGEIEEISSFLLFKAKTEELSELKDFNFPTVPLVTLNEPRCPICLQNYVDEELVAQHESIQRDSIHTHSYHAGCFYAWSGKECLICKEPVSLLDGWKISQIKEQ